MNFGIRLFVSLIFGAVLTCNLFLGEDRDLGADSSAPDSGRRYVPYIGSGLLLPMILLALLILAVVTNGFSFAADQLFSVLLGIFLHASLYYMVLMPLLPVLRRHFRARACATLWMLPNLLYLTIADFMALDRPLVILPLSATAFRLLLAIWGIGFVCVMSYFLLSHLRFRRIVLKDAQPVTDSVILAVWNRELEGAGIRKPKFSLVQSSRTATPLSIGIWERTVRVVLPEKSYTEEELALVLRHELIHVCREDSATKFLLRFCTAICWFNPLMWFAVKKSAEDIELSCDETVLLNAGDAARRQYADLILSAAGDDRGFTSCLSSAASTLRHRLKCIVRPARRRSGALLVGASAVLLLCSSGFTALASGETTGSQVLFGGKDAELRFAFDVGDGTMLSLDAASPEAVVEQLGELKLRRLSGNFDFVGDGRTLSIGLSCGGVTTVVELSDPYLAVSVLTEELRSKEFYLVEDGVDWELWNELLAVRPRLDLCLTVPDQPMGKDCPARLVRWQEIQADQTVEKAPDALPQQQIRGVWTPEPGAELQLSFSPAAVGGFTVQIEPLDGGSVRTVRSSDLADSFILPLPAQPSVIRFFADLRGVDGRVNRTEFEFYYAPDPS